MIDYKAAAAKAKEQYDWAGTDQLRFDNYARNILNAAHGDMVLYEIDEAATPAHMHKIKNLILFDGGLVQVWPEGDGG